MIVRIIFSIVSIAILFAGCAAPLPVDTQLVALMPDSAAKKVLERHLGAEWTSDPYIEKSGSCVAGFLKVTKERISFHEIKGITYNPTLGKLFVISEPAYAKFFGASCLTNISFKLDEVDAKEVTTALKSLGACTAYDTFRC